MTRAMMLRQLASEYEKLERMKSFVERIDIGGIDADFNLTWRLGASVDGYDDLRKAIVKEIVVTEIMRALSNNAVETQRKLVEDLAKRCGITEWQP